MRLPSSIRTGAAVSVLAHVALAGTVLLLSEVHPFAEVPEQRVEVEVVTADEAPPAPEPKPIEKPAEEKPQPKLDFDFSIKPTEQQQQQQAEAPQTRQAEAKPPGPKPTDTKPTEPKPPEAKPERKVETPAAKPQQPSPAPPPQQQSETQQPASAQAGAQPYPAAIPQEPDITVKYSVALGLPEGPAFDAPAEMAANISAESVAALRKKLKSCAPLPAGLSRSDNVKIVLRVALQPDGRLEQEPLMIQGTASTKGPALMKGAMAALEACQPYNMLPPDKYKEWKVLDLDFTPQDFRGG